MLDPTQMISLNDKVYRGIKVKVQFVDGAEKIEELHDESL